MISCPTKKPLSLLSPDQAAHLSATNGDLRTILDAKVISRTQLPPRLSLDDAVERDLSFAHEVLRLAARVGAAGRLDGLGQCDELAMKL